MSDSPIIGSTIMEGHVQFQDSELPELVKLEFHEDGTVTYKRIFGRHRETTGHPGVSRRARNDG